MLSKRFGRCQPFADINSREDNRYAGIQLGVNTYSTPEEGGEEEFQTSYFEIGGRCDHIADPLMDLFNVDREVQTASNASATDVARLRKADAKSDEKAADKSIEVTA